MDANKIGSFIKELRTEKNMTQKDLAEKVSCTDKAVSRWETGRGIPEVSLLMPLAKALDVSVNELLSGEKFITQSYAEDKERDYEPITVPELINKTDENLVSVISEKEREIKKKNKDTLILLSLFCVQALIFFVLPNMVKVDPAAFVVGASAANAFLAGFLRSKIKWTFPVFVVLMFVGFIMYTSGTAYGKFALVFAAWYIAGALGAMFISVLMGFVVKRLISLVKNKYKITKMESNYFYKTS